MRKLSKIFGVALIATSMLVSVTGCSIDYTAKIAELEAELSAKSNELIKADIKPVINVCGKKATITCNNDTYTNLIGTSVIVTYKIGEGESIGYNNAFTVNFGDEITATATFNNITSETTVTVSKSDYVVELEAAIAALNATIQEKIDEANALKSEIEAAKESKSVEKIREEYQSQIDALKDEKAILEDKVNTAETELASAKTKLATLNTRIEELEALLDTKVTVTFKLWRGSKNNWDTWAVVDGHSIVEQLNTTCDKGTLLVDLLKDYDGDVYTGITGDKILTSIKNPAYPFTDYKVNEISIKSELSSYVISGDTEVVIVY